MVQSAAGLNVHWSSQARCVRTHAGDRDAALLFSPPLSAPSSPDEGLRCGGMPCLELGEAHARKKKTRGGAAPSGREAGEASVFALPAPLLASVAGWCLAPLNEPSPAPVVERRIAMVDWDLFLMAEGSGGEDGEEADSARNPNVHRNALLEQLRRMRLVCRSWRDAIGSELVSTLYLNRCTLESKCWWPSSAMGRVTKPSQFIKTAPLPGDFATRFAGLRRLTLANLRMKFVPEQLQGLPLTQLNLSGNTLERLPDWFGSLPLRQLQLGDPWTGSWADGSPSRRMLHSLGEWLSTADERALPHTLQHLSLADTKGLTQLPKAVRQMKLLESLDIHCTTCSIENDDYLTGFPLRELVLLNSPSAAPNVPCWVPRLSCIQKLVLSNEVAYEHVENETFTQSLLDNLRTTFCPSAGRLCPSQATLSKTLLSLRLEDLQLERVPESLRSLVACEELNLSGWSVLHRLPEWLVELPLRKLLINNCYSLETQALPSSFAALESLRELHLLFVENIVGTSLGVDLSGAVGLECVERNLGALSSSRPELRFRVLSEIETREPGVSLCLESAYGFWTAAKGLDCEELAIANIALAFCDVCSAPLGFGNWWHKTGAGYDLCCKDYREHQNDSSHSERSEYVEVTSEQQIEDNHREFADYLRNSKILSLGDQSNEPTQEIEVEDDGIQVHDADEGGAVDHNDHAQAAGPGTDDDEEDDDDDTAAQQMFLEINDFIEHGLNGLNAEVWLAADEEMVEVTAPSGEGDGDHILQ